MSPHTLHRSTIPPVSMKEAYIHQHWEIQYKKCWQVNAEENRTDIEGVLTGECASEATRSLGHCGMIVGCRWYRRYLRNGSIVYFRKLEDHSRGRSSSPLFPSLLQGPNLLKGDTLWGWRLRVGGGRLGLVSTWRAARTRAGTAGRTSIQDDTTWRNIEGQKKKNWVHWTTSRTMFTSTMWVGVEVLSDALLWFNEPTWQVSTTTHKTLSVLRQQEIWESNLLDDQIKKKALSRQWVCCFYGTLILWLHWRALCE